MAGKLNNGAFFVLGDQGFACSGVVRVISCVRDCIWRGSYRITLNGHLAQKNTQMQLAFDGQKLVERGESLFP